METILQLAARNTERAKQIVQATNIINIWESIGAEINLVGSLKMGLMMKHRDIDFHVYTPRLTPAISFQAIMQLAANPAIKRIEYKNLIDTDEHCIEWHAWYEDTDHELWQIDMIHILKGSYYDGYFEQVAERISAVLTPEIRETILKLKYETPDTEEIMGIEYYQAVIQDGIHDYAAFQNWRKTHRMAGRLWFGAGIVMMLFSLLPKELLMLAVLCIAVTIAGLPYVYSYSLFRNKRTKGEKND